MREAPYINTVWQSGGPFTGDAKPHTRVTIQLPWDGDDPSVKDGDEDHVIHPTSLKVGNYTQRGVPLRWYQKADSSQNEKELPNVKTVTIDRSIETDASSCSITMYNQWMYDNGAIAPEDRAEGNRALAGYFNPTRGKYPESQARWGHVTNEWEDVLVPNALVRTYQGFGGHDKTLQQCLTDGNLILTGVWLIDDTKFSTNAELTIECRDMGKLLVEQQLFPPLVPATKYPLTYYRWVYDNFAVNAAARTLTTSSSVAVSLGDKRTIYVDSSTDRWYGYNYLLHGHRGTDSLDGNGNTYWLSVGNAGPDRAFATDWIEYECGEYINAVYVHTWAGNYQMYVSVMENGQWQGGATVPYDPSELYGNQPTVVNTGANIPYVQMYGTPWEAGQEYVLPRTYKADRVRVSFRHLAYSGIGPWMYRAGVREFRCRATTGAGNITSVSTETIQPFFFTSDSLRNPADENATGYITASQMGQIDAFGDCRIFPQSGGDSPSNANVYGMALTSSGDGYWVLRADGRITAYGAAASYGSPYTDGIGGTGGTDTLGGRWAAICKTPSNEGYWAVAVDGRVRAYGDATEFSDLGSSTTSTAWISDATAAPTGAHALWATHTSGTVYALGAATHYGNYVGPAEGGASRGLHAIRSTLDGTGYWLTSGAGRVEAKGSAVDYGEAITNGSPDVMKIAERIIATATDAGYWLVLTDGTVVPFGDADYFGSPVPGSVGQIRKNGNYLDYSDIIKDLALWSGFLLYDADIASNDTPPVYGNIETTGAYSKEKLPDDIFDKRPVIDAMTEIKETVGYLLFVDDEGGLRFESPNFWSFGNFMQDTGQRVYDLPEIDEKTNLMDYGTSRNDASLRSLIIISSEDPNEAGDSTVTTKIVPQTASGLKGLLKPAMWINGWFQDEEEQKIMAELIAMHIWFQQRLGQVTAAANPAIQINDQVRIYERQTDEVFIHYVRAVNTTHDLDAGEYTMTLTTHWLGTGEDWAITDNPDYIEDDEHFVLSQEAIAFLSATQASNGADFLLGFPHDDPSYIGIDPNPDIGTPGSGPTT